MPSSRLVLLTPFVEYAVSSMYFWYLCQKLVYLSSGILLYSIYFCVCLGARNM